MGRKHCPFSTWGSTSDLKKSNCLTPTRKYVAKNTQRKLIYDCLRFKAKPTQCRYQVKYNVLQRAKKPKSSKVEKINS